MQEFLADFNIGKAEGRYVPGELPNLPFANDTFDLAICSHFLFFYSDQFPLSFHLASLTELCRVAREVRVFPTLTYNAEQCPFVQPSVSCLRRIGLSVSVESVQYEFQRGGNQMIRIVKPENRRLQDTFDERTAFA